MEQTKRKFQKKASRHGKNIANSVVVMQEKRSYTSIFTNFMLVKRHIAPFPSQRTTNREVIITIEKQISCPQPESRTLLERIQYANVGSMFKNKRFKMSVMMFQVWVLTTNSELQSAIVS